MNLTHLKYFIEIYDTQSISIAAKNLYVTQPAVSQAIKKLEENFNAPLFYRANNRYFLTEFGDLIYRHGKVILKKVTDLNSDLDNLRQVQLKKSLRLGMNALFYLQYIDKISTFGAHNPHIQLNLVQDGSFAVQQKLTQNQLDFGIVSLPNYFPDDITITPLGGYDVYVVLPLDHPLSHYDKITFQDAIPYSIVALTDNFIMRKKLIKLAEENSVDLNIVATFDNIQLLSHSIKNMKAISFLPLEYKQIYQLNQLKWIPFDNKYNYIPYGIATHNKTARSTELSNLIYTIQNA